MRKNKKNLFVSVMVLLFLLVNTISPSVTIQAATLKVNVNGTDLSFSSSIKGNGKNTTVPAKELFNALNISYKYSAKTKTLTGKKENITVTIVMGGKTAKVNGKAYKIPYTAAVKSTPYAPLWFICKTFNASATYGADNKNVIMITDTNSADNTGAYFATISEERMAKFFIGDLIPNGSNIVSWEVNTYSSSMDYETEKSISDTWQFFKNKLKDGEFFDDIHSCKGIYNDKKYSILVTEKNGKAFVNINNSWGSDQLQNGSEVSQALPEAFQAYLPDGLYSSACSYEASRHIYRLYSYAENMDATVTFLKKQRELLSDYTAEETKKWNGSFNGVKASGYVKAKGGYSILLSAFVRLNENPNPTGNSENKVTYNAEITFEASLKQ